MALNSSSDVSIEDLDVSILQQVQEAIQRVAATQQESCHSEGDGPSSPLRRQAFRTEAEATGGHPSLEGLEEQRRLCERQITTLESEIELLEDELRRRERPLNDVSVEDIEGAISSLAATRAKHIESEDTQPPSNSTSSSIRGITIASSKSEERDIKLLRSQIKMNEAFSGIKFKSVEWDVTHSDDTGLLRKYSHIGSVYGFSFHVQFVVREEKASETDSERARIIAFGAQVNSKLQRGMQPFLSRLSRECDVMHFYQTYVKYCLLVQERRETFEEAKSAHGKGVTLNEGPDGTRLHFSMHRGAKLVITWSVSVTPLGIVDHSLSLQVKTPSSASDEQLEAFGHLPQLLQKMVLANGHSEALLKFLTLLRPSSRIK